MKVTLPFPPQACNPNRARRLHWSKQRRAAGDYRWQCWMLTRSARVKQNPALGERPLAVSVTFCPPDRRKRDRDNMIAAFKSGADGVADAIAVDDAEWEPSYKLGDPVKGGQVIVEVGTP